jgi:hypothetical protein
MDMEPSFEPRIVADNRTMVGLNTRTGNDNHRVPSDKFGTVVYDPPHVGPQGRDKSVKRFDADYGAHVACGKEHGWTLSYLYPPFLEQAKRVHKPDGLLLAKITDMVNGHRSRWAHCDFMRMAEEAGFIVCDLTIKTHNGPMQSNRWKTAHHARKRHCFWIVCRNGISCERYCFSTWPLDSRGRTKNEHVRGTRRMVTLLEFGPPTSPFRAAVRGRQLPCPKASCFAL